jgi:hypothetical protein
MFLLHLESFVNVFIIIASFSRLITCINLIIKMLCKPLCYYLNVINQYVLMRCNLIHMTDKKLKLGIRIFCFFYETNENENILQ